MHHRLVHESHEKDKVNQHGSRFAEGGLESAWLQDALLSCPETDDLGQLRIEHYAEGSIQSTLPLQIHQYLYTETLCSEHLARV